MPTASYTGFVPGDLAGYTATFPTDGVAAAAQVSVILDPPALSGLPVVEYRFTGSFELDIANGRETFVVTQVEVFSGGVKGLDIAASGAASLMTYAEYLAFANGLVAGHFAALRALLDAAETNDADGGAPFAIGGAGAVTMIGSSFADSFAFDDSGQVAKAGAGDDNATGGSGGDTMFLNAGNDSAVGGAGNDSLFGQKGDDALDGEGGDDFVSGGIGNDTVSGGDGNDLASGRGGDDSIAGGLGADILRGGRGNDALSGGDDDDRLNGGFGFNTLDGGAGADRFVIRDSGPPQVVQPSGVVILDFGVIADFTAGEDRLVLRLAGIDDIAQLTGTVTAGGLDLSWDFGTVHLAGITALGDIANDILVL